MNISQFKLTNGDQIICRVVGEPQSDDDVNLIVVNPMSISYISDPLDESKYSIALQPWMLYADQSDNFVLVNFTHIIGETKPTPILVAEYLQVVQTYEKLGKLRNEEYDKMIIKITEMGAEHSGNEVIDEMIQSHREDKEVKEATKSAKIIQMNPVNKDKLH